MLLHKSIAQQHTVVGDGQSRFAHTVLCSKPKENLYKMLDVLICTFNWPKYDIIESASPH